MTEEVRRAPGLILIVCSDHTQAGQQSEEPAEAVIEFQDLYPENSENVFGLFFFPLGFNLINVKYSMETGPRAVLLNLCFMEKSCLKLLKNIAPSLLSTVHL